MKKYIIDAGGNLARPDGELVATFEDSVNMDERFRIIDRLNEDWEEKEEEIRREYNRVVDDLEERLHRAETDLRKLQDKVEAAQDKVEAAIELLQ